MTYSARRTKSVFVATLAAAAFTASPAVARLNLEPVGAAGAAAQGSTSTQPAAVGVPRSQPVVVHSTPRNADTFDWGDAAIGAGGTLLVLTLAGGARAGVTRTRRGSRPAGTSASASA